MKNISGVRQVAKLIALALTSRMSADICAPSGHGGHCFRAGNTECCVSCEFVGCDDGFECYYCVWECNGRITNVYTTCD